MKIKIVYESKYSLSTVVDGENVLTGMAKITENKRREIKGSLRKEKSFLENVKEIKNHYPNYQYADITKNTVMGILCRLCGEIRRVDLLEVEHPILSLADKVSFNNVNKDFQNEIILLHTSIKEVQNNAGGVIPKGKSNHFLLSNNKLSESLFSVFNLKDKEAIVGFLENINKNTDKLDFIEARFLEDIKPNTLVYYYSLLEPEMVGIMEGLDFEEENNRLKEIGGRLYYGKKEDIKSLDIFYGENSGSETYKPSELEVKRKLLGVDKISNIWGFLFAKKITFLKEKGLFEEEFKGNINSVGSLVGLAPKSGGLTIKDYYTNFIKDKKLSWTMPYSLELSKDLFVEEDYKEFNVNAKLGVTKESGILEINIDLNKEEELRVCEMIENAKINTFQLGKKGLAYVEKIELEKQ